MTLESRNNRAMAAGQAAWDNQEPDDDGGRSDFIEAQVDLLMRGDDARDVLQNEYLAALDEVLACGECEDLAEIVLSAMNNDLNIASFLARKMAGRFEEVAINLIEKELERSQ